MLAHLRVVGELLREDVQSALQGPGGGVEAFFGVDKQRRLLQDLRRGVVAFHKPRRQRLQPRLFRLCRTRHAPGLVGQVQVFEFGLRQRVENLLFEPGRELALLPDTVENRGAALVEILVVFEAVLQIADLHFVEAAGLFFPVAGYEGNRRAFVEKREGVGYLERLQIEFDDELLGDVHG